MGKLQEALNRVKQSGVKPSTGGRRTKPVKEVKSSLTDGKDLWPNLVEYDVDLEVMAENRLIGGLKQSSGPLMAYNMLRTRLIKRLRDNRWSSMLVTSPGPGAGKSVTVLNLAFSIAREQNQRIYLIDADFRVPSLHRYLGIEPENHLTRYLDGECNLDDVVCSLGVDRLYTIFNTVQHEHSAELLTSPRMRQFVEELRARDPEGLIVFDTPPLLLADDVLAFSPQVDAITLIVAEGETEREDLSQSIALLADQNVVGIVLNKSRDVAQSAYY